MKNKIGVKVPNILMPKKGVDMNKWAVIACDQYTSQPEYWNDVEKNVGENYSTLNLILPEVYLEEKDYDVEGRIGKIHSNMRQHLEEKVLVSEEPGFMYVERKTEAETSRKGLVIAIDLEEYDYNANSKSLVRPTERTVIERIPPRVKVRENASVEFPHIMLLIDDPDKTIIEPLGEKKNSLKKVYDFDLMMGGGHIEGYKIDNESEIERIIKGFEGLIKPEEFNKKYN
jgi:uncharacterized protein (DUF1015 family)